MTLHATKGLEFLKVYIIGVEDGLIPHTNSMDDPSDLEEERRLLYVGMTRAQKKLYMISAERRRVLNNWVSFLPSRFLKEIPPKFFGLVETEQKKKDETSGPIKIGSKVFHQTYHSGVVKNILKAYNSYQALVSFNDYGLRKVDIKKIEKLPTKNLSGELSCDYNI